MSFILDALRKSESQRRLESVPDIMRVPIAVGRERLPSWAVVVMATLALVVVALIIVGWRIQQSRSDSGDERNAAATSERAPVVIEPSESRPQGQVEASQTPVAATEIPQAVPPEPARATTPEITRETAPTITPAVPPAVAPATAAHLPDPPPPSVPRRSIETSALPSAAALRGAGATIPELELQLLVTSSTPANRLVVINGRRYREGDRLSEGSEVVQISGEGVVLRHAGNEFLLVTN